MSIDLKTISQLRDQTGAGIADCKKALEEAQGDITKAIEVLRKRGEIKAATKGDRATKEGVVAFAGDNKKCAAVVLVCETDFVSRGEDFQNVATEMAQKLLTSDEEEFKSWADAKVKELVLKIGENIQLADFGIVEGEMLGRYVHHNKKVAAIVALDGGSEEVANDVAMQAVAMAPKYLTPEDIPAEVIEKEKEIYKELLQKEGKPEAIWDKIMEGKLAKFYEENCLNNQVYIKDDAKKIKDILDGAVIKKFVRYQV
ncbi:MAG: translation elongation factor Ts [Patescibacteria group bacterium]|jgi:elongation factor Ts